MITTIKKHKNLVPIFFLACLCLWTTYEITFIKYEYGGELYDRRFTRSIMQAFIAVFLNIGIYFFSHIYFKYSVIATVFLGFLGILNFTANTFTVTFIIPFQPVSAMVALLYLAINYNRVKARLDKANELNLAAIPDPEKIESLKNKYRQKTNEELVEILNDNRFVMEAKIASKELMEQRRKDA